MDGLSEASRISLASQAQITDSLWLLRQRGQKIAIFVLGKLLKLDLSISTPVETSCPVVGHTKQAAHGGLLNLDTPLHHAQVSD